MEKIQTVDTYPKDRDATELETLVIEGIVWYEAEPNMPEDVRVPISKERAEFLENGDDEPDDYEMMLMDIRDYIEDCYGYLIEDIDGWYIEA